MKGIFGVILAIACGLSLGEMVISKLKASLDTVSHTLKVK